jgi:hypothetical protein
VFERFTERARHAVALAQQEARALKHDHIGTEHLLLGLLAEEEGAAALALAALGVTIERARAEILKVVGAGQATTAGQVPFTPRAKKVLELALREALRLEHNYIGTEHILLGVIREREGVAAGILLELGADGEKVRREVARLMATDERTETGIWQPPAPFATGSRSMGAATLWARIAPAIRAELGREADAGDLLVLLASIPESLVARTLAELRIDERGLDAALTEVRRQGPSPFEERIELLRSQRSDAEAEGDEYAAAQLRAEELRARREHSEQLLDRVRKRLGLGEEPGAGRVADSPP